MDDRKKVIKRQQTEGLSRQKLPVCWLRKAARSLATGCAALGATLAMGSAVQGAETVIYTGVVGLQPDPYNATLSAIGPTGMNTADGAASVSGNDVSVNYTPNGTNDITGSVYGAFRWDATAVHDNLVTLNGGTVSGSVTGGYSHQGASEGNITVVSGGTVNAGGSVTGGWSYSGDADNNRAEISGGTISTAVLGGYSFNGNASGNRAIVTGGTMVYNVGGGFSINGQATNNLVEVRGGSIGTGIEGGYSLNGNADGNRVEVSAGTVGFFRGGYSQYGTASGNRAILSGGTIGYEVNGGASFTGDAIDNHVEIYGGTVGTHASGGHSIDGNVSGNTVTLAGGVVYGPVRGGWSTNGDTTDNAVIIRGGLADFYVYGGENTFGSVSRNTVTLENGTVSGDIFGGWSAYGDATNNAVVLPGGLAGLYIYGGSSSSGNAGGNRVTIEGGVVTGEIHGGSAFKDATNNHVEVSGGTVGASVLGGRSTEGNANDNSVTLDGGMVAGNIAGGWSRYGNATGNSVVIQGGTLHGDVFGGYVEQNSGNATGNTVTLAGNPTFGLSTRIMGGGTLSGTGDLCTGNTLEVLTSGLAVAEVNNFASYSFYLPADLASGDTVITIGGTTPTDLAGTTALITGLADGSPLLPGDRVTLISRTVGSPVNSNRIQGIQVGAVRVFDFKIYDQAGALQAEMVGTRLHPQTASFPEGRAAGLALVNQGGDLMQGSGLDALRSSTRQSGLAAFGAAALADQRIETGSHVDIDGFALMAGLGKGMDLAGGRTSLGLFFETGTGDYDAYNSLAAGDIRADGDTDFFGGGLLGRYETPSGWHGEAGVRTGRSETDYASGDIVLNGRSAAFSSSAWYGGGHLGVGYTWQIGQDNTLDLSTKLLYTHLDGDEVTILGDQVEFKSSDSLRWRTGVRFETAVAERFRPYVGAAYEHEFDGEIEATTYGMAIDAPSLEGGTGIGEVGLRAENLLDAGSLSLDLGMQGFVGQREGLGIQCRLRWLF